MVILFVGGILMYENTESYDVLLDKLNKMGSIKEIINNPILIDMVLSYNGDRHFTELFFRKIRNEIEMGNLSDKDLLFLRSGYLIRRLVNLDECVLEVKGRKLYKNELTDKISYLPEIGDNQVLINSLTSKEMISILFDDRVDDKAVAILNTVSSFYNDLPNDVKLSIVSVALLKGKNDIAEMLMDRDETKKR